MSKEEEVSEKKYKYKRPKKGSWYKKPRAKKVKPPQAVIPEKPERPRRAELKKIYREMLTTDIDQRVGTLAQAMNWYERCIEYVKYKSAEKKAKRYKERRKWHEVTNPWTLPQLKLLNALYAARTQGNNTLKSETKLEKYILAIEISEKITVMFKPPLLRVVLRRYEKDKSKLEERHKRFKNRFGEFLELMRTALKPLNTDGKPILLRVDKIKDQFRIDAEGNVTFDRKEVSNYRKMLRRRGMLPVILQMLPMLEDAAARFSEVDPHGHKTGRTVTSQKKARMAGHRMLFNLVQYQMLDPKPKKLVRRFRPRKLKVPPSEN